MDIETLAVNALQADAGVAAVVSDRVHQELPPGLKFPFLFLFRIGGVPDFIGHLDAPILQVEAWSKRKDEALDLARAALAALLELRLTGSFEEGVVTGATVLTGISWLPDPPTKTKRYTFRIQLNCHPLPATV